MPLCVCHLWQGTQPRSGLRQRKKLEGGTLVKKKQKTSQRSLHKRMFYDQLEYEDGSGNDEFENIILEMSMEETTDNSGVQDTVTITQRDIEVASVVGVEDDDCCDMLQNAVAVDVDKEDTIISDDGSFSIVNADEFDIKSLDTWSECGISDDGLEESLREALSEESLCQTLLKHCETKAEQSEASIVAALIQPDMKDIFVNAHMVSQCAGGIKTVEKFAHISGDIHTAVNVVIRWLKNSKEHTDLKLSKWCKTNGICGKVLCKVLRYAQEFGALNFNINISDDFVCAEKALGENVVNALIEAFNEDLCIYLGHLDMGYHRIRTGETIPCCPASSLRYLTKIPKYVICRPRHLHFDRNDRQCYHLLPLSAEKATGILQAVFPDFDEGCLNVVSPATEEFALDWRRCGDLSDLWNSEQVQHEVALVCDHAKVLVDVTFPSKIKIYAPRQFHEVAVVLLDLKIQELREKVYDTKMQLRFPNKKSNFSLVMKSGPVCQGVVFNSDPKLTLPIQRDTLVVFSTRVSFMLEIAANNEDGVNFNEEGKCAVYLQNIFGNRLSTTWRIEHFHLNPENEVAQVGITFYKKTTAHRALDMIRGIPYITILNEDNIQLQMRQFSIQIHYDVMTVMGQRVYTKLENIRRSTIYQATYDVMPSDREVKVTVTVRGRLIVRDAIDKFQFLIPLRLEQNQKHRSLLSEMGRSVFGVIGRDTDTFIYLQRSTLDVLIYGMDAEKKRAAKMLSGISLSTTLQLLSYGESTENTFSFPSDFFMTLTAKKQHIKGHNYYVDHVNKKIWIHSNQSTKKEMTEAVKTCIAKLMKSHYRLDFPEKTMVLEVPTEENTRCDNCHLPICTTPFTLECCRHSYCVKCLESHIERALVGNGLPLCCPKCDMVFTVQDVHDMTRVPVLKSSVPYRLIKTALHQFVTENETDFGFCQRRNCDGIYRKALKKNGGFSCGVCCRNVCPECRNFPHIGMSCEEFYSLILWMREDPERRRHCPNCCMILENDRPYGVKRCAYCKAMICWGCWVYTLFKNEDDMRSHVCNMTNDFKLNCYRFHRIIL